MKGLKAFVAHSFNKDRDGSVVKTFLEYFDSLKDTSGFEWDHAEKAELKAISQKVIEKIEGKNLFVGIFTGKDYRIEQDKLKSLFRSFKFGKRESFKACSSDWIIQESGYALAKGLYLLFLIEAGVDVNAGLQGDLQFINFSRDNPSACFTEINQILGSLAIKSVHDTSTSTSSSATEAKGDVIERQSINEISEAKEEKPIDAQDAYMSLKRLILDEKDIENAGKKLSEIIENFKTDEAFTPMFWQGIFYELKIDAGFSGALTELETWAESNPNDFEPLRTLGMVYNKSGQYSKAAEQFLKCAEIQKTNIGRISLLREAAACYASDKKFNEAYRILLKEFQDVKLNTETIHLLFKGLAEVAKAQENKKLFEAFAEKALELFPTDYDLRFSLAYSYGEAGSEASSLFHYEYLMRRRPNGSNLNNLGVQYQRLDIKGKSVDAYKEAFNKYGNYSAKKTLYFKIVLDTVF